jgi:hypothetical protein
LEIYEKRRKKDKWGKKKTWQKNRDGQIFEVCKILMQVKFWQKALKF